MNLAAMLVEKRAGLCFRWGQLVSVLLYRSAFAYLGHGAVLIRPMLLQGVRRISIGDGTVIHPGAWLATEGRESSLLIGERCYVGHRAHLHAISSVQIGDRCVIADNVMITTSDHERTDRHQVRDSGPVVIGNDVFVGQNCVILGGVKIGDGATIGAGAVVTCEVPAGAVAVGVPARVLPAKAS